MATLAGSFLSMRSIVGLFEATFFAGWRRARQAGGWGRCNAGSFDYLKQAKYIQIIILRAVAATRE